MKTKTLLVILFSLVSIFDVIAQKYYYISDAGNFQQGPYQILRYNEDGSNGKVFIKDGLAWPQDILFLPDSNQVLISNLSSNSVEVYDSESGAYKKRFISGILGPTRMKIGKDGMLYILQWLGDGKVKKYNTEGQFISNATQSGVNTSIGMDWDQNGDLYVSSYNGKFIERFDTDGKSKGKFISTGLFGPTNIAFNSDGQLIVLDYNSGRVLLYDKDGKLLKVLFQGVTNCEGIHLANDGKIIIGVGSSVRIYDNNNVFQKYLVPPGENGLRNANAVVCREMITTDTEEEHTEKKSNHFLMSLGANVYIVSPNADDITMINVFDVKGQLVFTFDVSKDTVLDLSDFNNGVYFARTNGMKYYNKTQKVIVAK
ncbi:MAG: T9SS type A sorting domain-containing protein [Saprospiraceae bacterium]|nr:T9SS type A sorting domain-containing protein [Saprospiraceae bacterium]MBP6569721.1 T9SS type A sorting domain-containing protein [Saprospiraceae bacterium]